jgi:hypothetical protein
MVNFIGSSEYSCLDPDFYKQLEYYLDFHLRIDPFPFGIIIIIAIRSSAI